MMKLLFICSRNQWRSPTAEVLWQRQPGFTARSAGTSPRARKVVEPADIRWADVILVMEQKHQDRLMAAFPRLLAHKAVHVLGIEDRYRYMDPALCQQLSQTVTRCLQQASPPATPEGDER